MPLFIQSRQFYTIHTIAFKNVKVTPSQITFSYSFFMVFLFNDASKKFKVLLFQCSRVKSTEGSGVKQA